MSPLKDYQNHHALVSNFIFILIHRWIIAYGLADIPDFQEGLGKPSCPQLPSQLVVRTLFFRLNQSRL